jgi:sugar phosphate isomerase/epimerase
MNLSLSVNLSDILTEKKSILENLFSWGSFFSNGLRPANIFSLLDTTKIEGIELVASKEIKKMDIEKVKAILDKNGIAVFSIHQPILTLYRLSLEKIKRLFETAAYLSAKIIVVHLFSLGKKIHDPAFLKELKSLEEKFDIKIAIENGTKNIILGLKKYCYEGKEFSKTVLKAGFDITFDISHLAEAGDDIINFYEQNKERIINIHLSDYKSGLFKNNLFNMHLPLGKGDLLIEDFLKVLKESRYDGLLTLEINRGVKDIIESADFIRLCSGLFN